MSRLERALIRLVRDLEELRVRWALVGGLALAARGVARMTRDIDVAVAVHDDDEADRLVADLRARGYGTGEVLWQEEVERLATARLSAPGEPVEGLVVDLLFASSGIEAEVVGTAETLEILSGLEAPVVTLAYLVALKVLAARPLDLADAERLLEKATAADVETVVEALDLISQRGFDRGQDLAAIFSRLRTRRRHP